jgi:hypothetical protein
MKGLLDIAQDRPAMEVVVAKLKELWDCQKWQSDVQMATTAAIDPNYAYRTTWC